MYWYKLFSYFVKAVSPVLMPSHECITNETYIKSGAVTNYNKTQRIVKRQQNYLDILYTFHARGHLGENNSMETVSWLSLFRTGHAP